MSHILTATGGGFTGGSLNNTSCKPSLLEEWESPRCLLASASIICSRLGSIGSGKKLRKSEVLHGHDGGKNAGIRRQECDMCVVKHGQEVSEKSEGVSEERVALVWLEKHEKI